MVSFVKREWALLCFLTLLIALSVLFPWKIKDYPRYIDWETLATLLGLMIVVTGVKESGYLEEAAYRLTGKTNDLRKLAITMCLISAALSSVFTNDVTLFIVVPITLSLSGLTQEEVEKLVIFEAMAVNSGSVLTPIGNPQNIYLWHLWNIPFASFCAKMLPVAAIMIFALIAFSFMSFPAKRIIPNRITKQREDDLFAVSVVLGALYIAAVELDFTYPATALLIVIYFLLFRRILAKTDWLLLLLFAVIFIDFNVLAQLPLIKAIFAKETGSPTETYLASIAASQVFSNVPAAVLMSKLSHNIRAIAYGVSIGGNGIVIGSLANIIALRMLKRGRAFLRFHLYSVPFLVITGLMALILFKI